MKLATRQQKRAFTKIYKAICDDIYVFCKALNFSPTDQQKEALDIAQAAATLPIGEAPTHAAIKSGQGPGKTTISTIIGLWWALRHHGSLVVVTAPTMRQAKEVWLAEARKRIGLAHPVVQSWFEVRATEIEIMGVEDWGVKLASASRPENMQGWHNDQLAFIVDEASGVDRAIIETIMGTLTNPRKFFLQIGNPNTRDSSFFDAFNRDRHNWKTLTMSAEDSPIVDKKNILRMEELYGRDSDVFRVRVLGEFPLQDPFCVMNSDDLEYCARKVSMLDAVAAGNGEKQMGIDYARFGDDRSVVYRRSGLAIVESASFAKVDPSQVTAQAFEMQRKAAWRDEDCWFVPDATGMGQGVMFLFHNSGKRVHEFVFNGGPQDSQFHDKITEAFFCMAQLVRQRKCHIPDDPELIQELSSRQYYMTKDSKIKIESKDEYRKRTEASSPDKADAMVLTFYDMSKMKVKVAR